MPSPEAGVRNREPAGLRNPRRCGLADGTAKEFAGRLAGAHCPALRSAGLFGSETGSPRARAVQGTGIPGVPNISLQRKYWGGFRGGGRRAEPGLRTSTPLVPRRGKKSPRPVYAPQGYRPQQKKKNNALSEGPPPAQNYSNTLKNGKEHRLAGVVGGPNPACGPQRHLCPEGVKKARGHSRKKPPPPGPSRYKRGSSSEGLPSV